MKIPPKLKALGPCGEAVTWLKSCKYRSAQVAWDKCERGDWMMWLLGKLSGAPESKGRKQLVRAACGCARLALKFVNQGEHRPRVCIETAEAWADGKTTIAQVRQARAAYAADAAAYAAAYAAADAADATDAAYADAAAYAAAYAYAAYADASAYAADAARKQMLKDCADVVRKFYPKVPKL